MPVLQGYSNQTINDPSVSANSRPLSKFPFMSKVLEKVVVTQLLVHLQRNSLFEMIKSGFRSSQQRLVKVPDDLRPSDSGLIVQ